jgi:hypothetical protein
VRRFIAAFFSHDNGRPVSSIIAQEKTAGGSLCRPPNQSGDESPHSKKFAAFAFFAFQRKNQNG